MRRSVFALIGAVSAACLFSPMAVARDGGLFSSLFDPTPSPTAEGRPRASAIPRELVPYQGRFAPGTIIISTCVMAVRGMKSPLGVAVALKSRVENQQAPAAAKTAA